MARRVVSGPFFCPKAFSVPADMQGTEKSMALPAFTINTDGARFEAIGASFAYDLTRRISQSKGLDGVNAAQDASAAQVDDEQAAALAAKQSELEKLESALSSTVAYMKEKHGDQAASAMIGLVYKRLGDGDINEETLGNAFLDVTRFIDKNFGTGAGDDFMAHLNGSLNDSMNTFFDNGLNETFMVAPASSGGGGGADTAGMLEEITKQYTDAIKEMIEEARVKADEKGVAGAYADPAQNAPMIGVMKDIIV